MSIFKNPCINELNKSESYRVFLLDEYIPHGDVQITKGNARALIMRDQSSSVWLSTFYEWVNTGNNRYVINGLDIPSIFNLIFGKVDSVDYEFLCRKIRNCVHPYNDDNYRPPVNIMGNYAAVSSGFPVLAKNKRSCMWRLYTMPWEDTIKWAEGRDNPITEPKKMRHGSTTKIVLNSNDSVTVDLKNGEITILHGDCE